MKAFTAALSLVLATSAVAYPSASKKLSQSELRASLITKDNVAEYIRNQRAKKSMEVPKPFVITTSLNVKEASNSRQSRTFFDKDGATVIQGVRMPDDESDKVTWRNGRVINNIFVPDGAVVPESVNVRQRQPKNFDFDDFYAGREPLLPDNMAIESRSDQVYVEAPQEFKESRDYKYHAGSTEKGRPVYYVVEEPDSLHSDRSPYDFEPADTHTSLSSHVADYTQSGLSQATSGDFVIKEHTYTMCPGCPTFSIPVPIPKTVLGQDTPGSKIDYQYARNRTFLEKIGDRIVNGFQKVQQTVLGAIDPILSSTSDFGSEIFGNDLEQQQTSIQEKIDKPIGVSKGNGKSYMPLAIAGMAALTIGGMALFASSSPAKQFITSDNKRSLQSSEDSAFKSLQKSIEKYGN